jgi:Ser/Thr protein kinase RdoA (MazF antagonist)
MHAVHKTPPPPEAPLLRDYVTGGLRRAGGMLREDVVTGVLALIERLSPGDGLCHGDPHTGNVIMTADGPRLIDWIATMRAPAVLDLALAHVALCEVAPEIVEDPHRPRAVYAAMQPAYAQLAGLSPVALTAAMEPYLPIARTLLLLSGAASMQRTRLIQRLEASFDWEA